MDMAMDMDMVIQDTEKHLCSSSYFLSCLLSSVQLGAKKQEGAPSCFYICFHFCRNRTNNNMAPEAKPVIRPIQYPNGPAVV